MVSYWIRTPALLREEAAANYFYRNSGFWIPSKHRDGYTEDVHYDRGCEIGTNNGGLGEDYYAGNRRSLMEKGRC